ncbi:hypothetical protein V1525DRAFT_402525 [Lipomyces kononenkoae]|uniref:Uncharacterized protein n=1 Tax=Lipomyces kononenkoae TaxID=34357 RepID=A0ACC3T212_LIPKO
MSARLLLTRQRVIGAIASVKQLIPVRSQFTIVTADGTKGTLPLVEADESVPKVKRNPLKKVATHKRNIRRKKVLFAQQTSTFDGALERLKTKTEKPTIAEGKVRKLTQDELLAASVQKRQAGVVSAPNNSARRKMLTRLKPSSPSQHLMTLLVSRVETKEQAAELKKQMKRLANDELYVMPSWQSTKMVRNLTLKGLYTDASDLVSHSALYSLAFDYPVKAELLRAFAIRCETFGWHLGHMRKVRNMLVRLADAKEDRVFKVPQFTAIGIGALTALRANDANPPQEFLNAYKAELKSFVSALEGRWHEFPRVGPTEQELTSVRFLSELQRRVIDFELSLNGLQRAVADVPSGQQKFLNAAIGQIEESLNKAKGILAEQAQQMNKEGFSNLTIDSYRRAFLTEKSALQDSEISEAPTEKTTDE